MHLDKKRYVITMKISLDNFLCWLLIRSAETYYGDSLNEAIISSDINKKTKKALY
tara:strand:- start:46 stop:210 length:165 start_codon:yes stop_codon:yes gene_type:complete